MRADTARLVTTNVMLPLAGGIGEVIRHGLERRFGLPRQIRVRGPMSVAVVTLHKSITCHVKVVERIFAVRQARRDEGKDECAAHPSSIEDLKQRSELTGLEALIAHIVAIQLFP